jgi:hypothetical protein
MNIGLFKFATPKSGLPTPRPNSSIEPTATSTLRVLASAAHVER